jgi:WD40 repeat protein
MRRWFPLFCVLAALLMWRPLPGRPDGVAEPPHVDRNGDPLPAQAVARFGTLRLRHQRWHLTSAAFSPDGKVLASVAGWPPVCLWETTTGKELARIRESDERHSVLCFSPSGKLLAGTVHKDGGNNLYLWDARTGQRVQRFVGHKEAALAAAFVEDGKTLVSVGRDGFVRWWDVETAKFLRVWDPLGEARKAEGPGDKKPDGFYRAQLTPDGGMLVAVLAEREGNDVISVIRPTSALKAWDVRQGKELWTLSDKNAQPVEFDLSEDGRVLALPVGKENAAVSIRDGQTGQERRVIRDPARDDHFQSVESVSLTPDGKVVAAMGQGPIGLRVWDVATGELLNQLDDMLVSGLSSDLRRPIFAPDGATLVFPLERTLAVWNAVTATERVTLAGHRRPVLHVYFSPDGKSLLSGTEGRWPEWGAPEEAIQWDIATGKETSRSVLGRNSGRLDPVSLDHRLGVVFSWDTGAFALAETDTGKVLRPLDILSKGIYCTGGFFSPSGKLVAQPLRNELAIVDVSTGKKLVVLPDEKPMDAWFAFAPNDKRLAWYDRTGLIHVVQVDTGKELWMLGKKREGRWDYYNPRPTLAFSASGDVLASWEGDTNVITLWDLTTGKEMQKIPLKGERFGAELHLCLAFAPDGKTLAAGCVGGDNDIHLYDVASGKDCDRLTGHVGKVRSLAFSPDGKRLASGSDDTTVLLWELKPAGRP